MIPRPSTTVPEIYNSVRFFLGHNYYTLSSSEPCPGVENFFLKKYNNFLSPYPTGVAFQIWSRLAQ